MSTNHHTFDGLAARVAHRRRHRQIRAAVIATICLIAVTLGLVAPGMAWTGTMAEGAQASDGTTGSAFEVEDGYIADGEAVSPFADDLPAIARLEPDLRAAMQEAAGAAIEDGVDFVVTNGWRSADYQQALLDAAVIEYGSLEAASRYVAAPETSKHVTGEAVDIGRTDADSWLSQHGSDYGLCQTYTNEMWHFELATEPGGECPPQLTDASAG